MNNRFINLRAIETEEAAQKSAAAESAVDGPACAVTMSGKPLPINPDASATAGSPATDTSVTMSGKPSAIASVTMNGKPVTIASITMSGKPSAIASVTMSGKLINVRGDAV